MSVFGVCQCECVCARAWILGLVHAHNDDDSVSCSPSGTFLCIYSMIPVVVRHREDSYALLAKLRHILHLQMETHTSSTSCAITPAALLHARFFQDSKRLCTALHLEKPRCYPLKGLPA
jgi:hypothetical protein